VNGLAKTGVDVREQKIHRMDRPVCLLVLEHCCFYDLGVRRALRCLMTMNQWERESVARQT